MNPKVTLTPNGTGGHTWAHLLLDDGTRYEYLFNPVDMEYEAKQTLSTLEVKQRGQPTLVYQSSATTLTHTVYLWSPGNNLKPLVDGLVALTQPNAKGQTPWVTLVYGATRHERLKVTSFRYKVTSMPGGLPDRVKGTITYAFGDKTPAPKVEKVSKLLTERERSEGIRKLQQRINTDAAYAASLGITTSAIVIVAQDGTVTANPNSTKDRKVLGSLKDLLNGLTTNTSTPRPSV